MWPHTTLGSLWTVHFALRGVVDAALVRQVLAGDNPISIAIIPG
ncbi:MAG: hypothetical protein ABIJ00_09300 [Candidatus Eisenbacteria bacterium]